MACNLQGLVICEEWTPLSLDMWHGMAKKDQTATRQIMTLQRTLASWPYYFPCSIYGNILMVTHNGDTRFAFAAIMRKYNMKKYLGIHLLRSNWMITCETYWIIIFRCFEKAEKNISQYFSQWRKWYFTSKLTPRITVFNFRVPDRCLKMFNIALIISCVNLWQRNRNL